MQVQFSVFVLIYVLSSSYSFADEANTIAGMCADAINAIEGYRGEVQSGLIENGNRVLIDKFFVNWEKSSGRARFEGQQYSAGENGQVPTDKYVALFEDGNLKTLSKISKQGMIQSGGNVDYYRHIPFLLGYNLMRKPTRDVVTMLSSGRAKMADAPGTAIEIDYERRPGTPDSTPWKVRVTVDEDHGFLPSKIECIFGKTGLAQTKIEVSRFEQTGDLWVPVEGTLELFDTGIHVPDGYTMDEILEMSMTKREEIGAIYKSVSLGPEYISISPASLNVNIPFTKDDFQIRFPENCLVYDSIQDRTLISDGEGHLVERAEKKRTTDQLKAKPRFSYLLYFNLAALSILFILAWLKWKR